MEKNEKKNFETAGHYELIPMNQITDEARHIAVKWMECDDKNWIGHKHKLASDIMNYANKFHKQAIDRAELFPTEHHLMELKCLLGNINQIFVGWHSDATAWSEWDEKIFKELVKMQMRLEEF